MCYDPVFRLTMKITKKRKKIRCVFLFKRSFQRRVGDSFPPQNTRPPLATNRGDWPCLPAVAWRVSVVSCERGRGVLQGSRQSFELNKSAPIAKAGE